MLRVVPPGVDPARRRRGRWRRAQRRDAAARGPARQRHRPAAAAGVGRRRPRRRAAGAGPGRGAAGAAAPREGDDDVAWGWPAAAPVSTPFDEARNKGLVFRGKAGDPVLAAADGRVVYAGSGLRGYGNLVILKHNATYLTAYAHNQTLLVKDDQPSSAARRSPRWARPTPTACSCISRSGARASRSTRRGCCRRAEPAA